MRVTTIEELLRRLALQDELVVQETLALRPAATARPLLPQRAQGVARLSALIAMDASVVSYQAAVIDGLAAGATATSVPTISSAAPAIATALGYELDDAFERMDGLATDNTSSPVRTRAGHSEQLTRRGPQQGHAQRGGPPAAGVLWDPTDRWRTR